MIHIRTSLTVAVAVAILSASNAVSQGTTPYSVVALSGQQAPGSSGTYNQFIQPRLTASGLVMIHSHLTAAPSPGQGIWVGSPGALQLVAVSGAPAPAAGDDVRFKDIDNPVLNDAGQVAFSATLTGTGVTQDNDESLWLRSADGLKLLAREGATAPGASGQPWSGFVDLRFGDYFPAFCGPTLNNTGQVVFQGRLRDHGTGIWLHSSGTVRAIALGSDPAPGAPPGFTYGDFDGSPRLSDSGKLAFEHRHDGFGIWAGSPESLQPIALKGNPAPDAGPATYAWLHSPKLNSSSIVGFSAAIDTDRALYVGPLDSPRLVARTGQPAPGMQDRTFDFFLGGPVVYDSGNFAFEAILNQEPGTKQQSGIWMGSSDALNLIALSGSPAPGLDGVVGNSFSLPQLCDSGHLLFYASLTGLGVTQDNDYSLWLRDPSGNLTLILRTGDPFLLPDHSSRIIKSCAGHDLTRLGDLLLTLNFTDRSSGVFMANIIPEPTTSGFLAAAVLFLSFRRKSAAQPDANTPT